MIIVTQIFLYLVFAILTGSFLFGLIPETKKPAVHVPMPLIIASIVAIPVLSFIPVVQVTLFFYEGIGFWQTLKSVIFTFEVGQAWLVTLGVSFLLLTSAVLPISFTTKAILGLVYTFVLIVAVGWASHGASIAGLQGALVHTAHFAAVSVWVGSLLVVAWFSQGVTNWRSFLSWFHPLAITCVLITIIAGIFLMFYGVAPEDYLTSWMLPYGQALIIKHLLVLPLIGYAFINGYMMKKRIARQPEFNPKPWTKVETLIVFFIFIVTAVLGETAPPHTPDLLLETDGTAWLFQLFYPQAGQGSLIAFQLSMLSVGLMVMASLFLVLLIISFAKKAPAVFSLVMSVLVVISGYLALMLSVQI